MHHRRRGLTTALAALVVLVAITGGACSDDADGSAASSSGSGPPEGSTRPTGSVVPGGSVPPSTTGAGPTTTTPLPPPVDPSADIPRDQFCRGFAEVEGSETVMEDARAVDDLTSFKTGYTRLTDAYQAMAENPPDEVYDEVRAVFFVYDELSPQVAAAASTGDLTALALQIQGGDGAENLRVVRDYAAAELLTRHYLDHASTSTLRPEARDAMVGWLGGPAGDPGRIHAEGMTARVAVEEAREHVAGLLGAGHGRSCSPAGRPRRSPRRASVLATAAAGRSSRRSSTPRCASAALAGPVAVIGVDTVGRVDVDALLEAITRDTALVHLQWGNHEVGTVQPVVEVVAACRERGVLVHVDAAQAAGRVPIDFRALGADLLSVSAHKLGGPPGVGALVVRRGLRLEPLLRGGDQERARRAGMENVPAVIGFGAAALALAEPGRVEREAAEQRRLADRVLAAVPSLDGVVVYGDAGPGPGRLAHLVCLGVTGIEPQAVLLGLDRAGIAAHSGSACSTESLEPSPVLEAMGVDAHRSLRLSVGWDSTDDDIDALLAALPEVIAGLRSLGAERR